MDDIVVIVDACRIAWNKLISAPQTITSIATRHWENVSGHWATCILRPLLWDAPFANANQAYGAALAISASGIVHRSEFAMTKYAPFVGDDVRIRTAVSLTCGG